MGVSPVSILRRPENPMDFRAPPPSPVASGRRSCVTNEDVLSDFLETSLQVPDLVLPDKIFPMQRFIDNPARIDFGLLAAGKEEGDGAVGAMVESISRVGCFQLVNLGIPTEVLKAVMEATGGIFKLPQENRAGVARSPERRYGFEEEESELVEEFVWYRDGGLFSEMEKIWPLGYANFRGRMINLITEFEKVADKLFMVLWENFLKKLSTIRPEDLVNDRTEDVGPVCCLFKHRPSVPADRWANSLRYDVIRMLIQANDYSHVLGVHVFDGCKEFHVYSKKGWVAFCPDKDSVIVTVGDQFQILSGGEYKHVVGRAVFKEGGEDHISMAFLYGPPLSQRMSADDSDEHHENVISITHQLMVAVMFTLLYQLLVYVYNHF